MTNKPRPASKLAKLRIRKGLTQSAAAYTLGITPTYVSTLENGHFAPQHALVMRMCKLYEVDANTLTAAIQHGLRSKPE
jgi:transcriptional regulator with XRE-family HTH domain